VKTLITALAAWGLAASTCLAASPELRIPDFEGLRGRATDSVDITIDGMLMAIAKRFAKNSGDEEMELLSDIKSVRIRNFEFDSEGAYSRADIDAVRRQLDAPGWSQLVSAHRRDDHENVDVYVCTENEKILGVAVVASEPRSFTIVNIVGSIDIDKLAKLEGKFGIPKVDVEQ
jgi:Domain of unknown function (DUF4252)